MDETADEALLPVELRPLAEVEQEHVLWVLMRLRANVSAAARVLGIDRRTLYRKLAKWGKA